MTMRVLEPSEGILAFYDGREEGATLEGADWVEYDLVLGLASYAIVEGDSALVYDTHTSPDRGEFVRAELERRGVSGLHGRPQPLAPRPHRGRRRLRGLRGDRDRADGRAPRRQTATRSRAADSADRRAIDPVVTPTRTFGDRLSLTIGSREAELIHVNIHSDDAAVLWLPDERILLAGDTLEDTVTYVDEPESLETHLAELDRLAALGPEQILPAHGDPNVIANGGYPPGSSRRPRRTSAASSRAATTRACATCPLREFIADVARRRDARLPRALRDGPPRQRGQGGSGVKPVQDRLLGLGLQGLARRVLSREAAAAPLARALLVRLRHGRDQQHLLPPAHRGGRQGLGRADAGRLRVRGQGRPLHDPHQAAPQLRQVLDALLQGARAAREGRASSRSSCGSCRRTSSRTSSRLEAALDVLDNRPGAPLLRVPPRDVVSRRTPTTSCARTTRRW